MKPTIGIAFGHFATDDRGYPRGASLGWYPIEAAATSKLGKGGYETVSRVVTIAFHDEIYILKKELGRATVMGQKMASFNVTMTYKDYVYENGFDKSQYYVGDNSVLTLLGDGRIHNLSMTYLIRDDDNNFYELQSPDPIKIEKFLKSREIAIVHALSKLTKEEQKLLGLV